MKQSIVSIGYTKSFELKPNSIVTVTQNLKESFFSSMELLGRCFVSQAMQWQLLRNLLNFLSLTPLMISWYHDKSHEFKTSFVFLYNLKHIRPHLRGHVSWTRFSNFPLNSSTMPPSGINNMYMIFPLIILYYSNHLQFKFELSLKYPLNEII